MKPQAFAAIFLAMAMFTAVPAVFADQADAYSATDGSQGIGYSYKNLSATDFGKLYTDSDTESMAEDILDRFVSDTTDFTISGVTVTEMCASAYLGESVKGTSVTTLNAGTTSYKITFTATTDTEGDTLFTNGEINVGMIKEVGLDNKTQAGATFTVSAVCSFSDSQSTVSDYVANASSEFVLVKETNSNATRECVKADVTYEFISGGQPKSVKATYDFDRKSAADMAAAHDFNGKEAKDVVSTDKCITETSISNMSMRMKSQCTCGGKTYGTDITLGDGDTKLLISMMSIGTRVETVKIVTSDLVAPEYLYYGTGPNALFDSSTVASTDLQNNDAMLTFLKSAGTVADSYSAVKSAADSVHDDIAGKGSSKTIYYVAIAGVVAAVILVSFLILRKR